MGCTTSASTVYTPDANATGKHIKFTEDIKQRLDDEQITAKVQDEKVLPTCDTLAETIQLSNNNNNNEQSSTHMMSTVDNAKVCQPNENQNMEPDSIADDKISSLEEVVEKVIEINNIDSHEKITHSDLNNETDTVIVDTNENRCEASDSMTIINDNEHDNKTCEDENGSSDSIEEYLEEATSPTQSESSRATRWEALADIAAELPPSLTVDPITGQIYSLTK